jgi:putative phosphoesterase
MKLGVISDIHGDPVSLELAWSHLTVMGAERIVSAGDLAGYGPFPDRVVAFMRDRNIPSVRGNHDRWALERGLGASDPFGGGTPSGETLEYFESLPAGMRLDLPIPVAVFHGSPRSDMEFVNRHSHPPKVLRRYLTEQACRLLIVGHTHTPMYFRCPEGLVINPGSIVSIGNLDSSRTFVLVDLTTEVASFHDVETGEPIEVEAYAWPTE